MTEHLGHEKHQAPTVENGSIGNGTWPKIVLADAAGEVRIAVPGGRGWQVRTGDRPRSDNVASGTWTPSRPAYVVKGLTTGEISAHFHEV